MEAAHAPAALGLVVGLDHVEGLSRRLKGTLDVKFQARMCFPTLEALDQGSIRTASRPFFLAGSALQYNWYDHCM